MAIAPLLTANKALAKLTILSFKNKKPYIRPAGPPFIAMYNPNTFSTSHGQAILPKDKTDGFEGVIEIKNTRNQSVKIDLLLDATGASPAGGFVGSALSAASKAVGSVDLLVAAFFAATMKRDTESHSPNNLRIIWGAGLFFECILESATVTYNLFDRTGRPIRATISATFVENPISEIAKIKNFLSSPDVTKTYIVKAGDTLCNLAQNEYGDESLYLEIAKANDLKNYRKLIPGQVLIFPPIAKGEE